MKKDAFLILAYCDTEYAVKTLHAASTIPYSPPQTHTWETVLFKETTHPENKPHCFS